MRTRNWRRAVDVAGVSICIGGAILGIRFLRRQWIDHKEHEHRVHLFRQASFSPGSTGSDGEIRAVRELGTDPSNEAERMLIDLSSHPGFLDASVQQEAIRELAKRDDTQIPSLLAALIQPGTLLDSRIAAAQALQSMPCNPRCTRSLLSYLNRIDSGELNAEQQGLDALGTEPSRSVEAMTKPHEQRIYALLYAVLLRSPDTTSNVLEQDYGLGTASPKHFAIVFVTQANSKAFCPTLLRSEQLALSAANVTEAIKALKCSEK